MEEVFFWDNPDNKPDKTVMYNRYQSAPRWKILLKIFEDKYSDYKKGTLYCCMFIVHNYIFPIHKVKR